LLINENGPVEVKWSKPALIQLDKALDFIIENGFISYAAELEESRISRIDNLIDNHTIYRTDKYKKDNDGFIELLKWMNTGYRIA